MIFRAARKASLINRYGNKLSIAKSHIKNKEIFPEFIF